MDRGVAAARPAARAVRLAAVALALWLGAGALLVAMADRFLYHPSRAIDVTPANFDLVYQDLRLPAGDGVELHAWWIPAGADAPPLLFLHGNAGNIAGRLPFVKRLNRAGVAVLLLSWRGYGRSAGAPSEAGLVRDALAGFRWLRERRMPVHVYGESLGATVAALAAAREPADRVILQSGFASLAAMAAAVYPWLPARWMVPGRFDAEAAAASIAAPVMVLHGDRDEVVPFEQGERLYRAATRSAERIFVRVAGAGHNDVHASDPALVDRIRAWIAQPPVTEPTGDR